MIESGNRSVMQERLKLPGMRWSVESAQFVLTFKCKYDSNLWESVVVLTAATYFVAMRQQGLPLAPPLPEIQYIPLFFNTLLIAVLGATAFSAQAFTIPYNNTTNNAADSAAGWMVNKNFAAVQGELNAQEQNIAANKTQIEKNAEAIKNNYAEMKQNFAAMNTRIDDLDEEMKKGFASQAALAGLFQPYNVGKFNLSVALGGYESEQAMALGTGYRFNENFAMKAGIATDVGGFDHLTYNIGANFEW